jgi:hypothetical protein
MNKLTRAASGALAALTCVALTVDVGAQGRTGRSGAPGPQGRTGGPATPSAAVNIADDPLSGPVVTNAPFSADAVTTVTQILGDGTRIEQTTTARFYRDSIGRVRNEQTVLGLGALDPSSQPRTTITVMTEPDNRAMYTLDPVNKTARRGADVRAYFALSASSGTVSVGATPTAAYTVTLDAANRERERRAVTIQNGVSAVQGRLAAVRITEADGNAVRQPDDALGTRQIEGVSAVGRRTKSVIPTGKIGNDRPIEITDERWESQDLRLLVRSHHRDPRTGDVEYRLMNIVRAEPSADLFMVPSDYTVLGDTLNAVPGVRTGGPGAGAGVGGGGGRGARQGGTPAN